MPWRCFDHILQKAGEKIGVPYLPDRCAQLTVAHNGRPACHYCGNCSRGCDVGSFFSPTWFTIPEAEATGRLTLLTDALVRSVLVDQDGMATGVAYVDRKAMKEVEVHGRVVVLAASCVETAHIMLNSRSRHWPTGIANSSGQVGRNLCDHLYGCPGYGHLPQLVGQPPTPDNIADSTVTWMPRWQNLANPREERFIRGYSIYMGGGCGEFPGHYRHLEGFGREFKRDIKRYYPSAISALIQAPSLPSPTNYVDIDPHKKDIFGIPALRFHFEWGDNELMMWEHSKQVMIDLFKAAGGELWGADTEPNRAGTSLHETGVCRFGNNPKTSVTDKWAQTHDVPNLYICDASIFPSCTDKTTTMPIVAFTMRTCEHIQKRCSQPCINDSKKFGSYEAKGASGTGAAQNPGRQGAAYVGPSAKSCRCSRGLDVGSCPLRSLPEQQCFDRRNNYRPERRDGRRGLGRSNVQGHERDFPLC